MIYDDTDARVVAAVDRYMAGCTRDGDCLVRDVKSYGWISVGRDSRWLAHRIVHAVKVGPIAEGQVVRHKCDRKQCVEPSHLLAGTHSQNVRDIFDRNRRKQAPGRPGESNPSARLTDDLVAQLRREVRAGGTLRGVAAAHDLNYTAVRQAVRGYSWAHVTAEPPVLQVRRCKQPSARLLPIETARKAKQLADAGLSLTAIGEHLHVNRVTAHRLVHRAEKEAS